MSPLCHAPASLPKPTTSCWQRLPPVPVFSLTLIMCLQSLHTTVLPLGTTSERKPLFPLELHIRTGEMHRLAEYGIAGQLLTLFWQWRCNSHMCTCDTDGSIAHSPCGIQESSTVSYMVSQLLASDVEVRCLHSCTLQICNTLCLMVLSQGSYSMHSLCLPGSTDQ